MVNGVLLLGEALGKQEARDSLPFRPNAPAGAILQGILRRIMGGDRNNFLIANTIWCQPGANNFLANSYEEFPAIEHCQKAFTGPLIQKRRPRAIVAIGAIPARTATGLAGYNQGIKLIRGFVIPSNRPEYLVDGKPIPVIPTFHPSYLLRGSKTRSKDEEIQGKTEKAEGGMALSGVIARDIELALAIAAGKLDMTKPKFEVIHGTRDIMEKFINMAKRHPEKAIAWDIETPRSVLKAHDESEIDTIKGNVTQIQFALDETQGYVFPGFDARYVLEGTKTLLGLPNRKLSWNGWKFDNKVVTGFYGIPILGVDCDLMSKWAWIQPDLPRGLQFAASFAVPTLGPWKHLAQCGFGESQESMTDDPCPWGEDNVQQDIKEMDYYGCCDVITLHHLDRFIDKIMARYGLANSYERHVLSLRPEMQEASRRGIPLDAEKHHAFGVKVGLERDRIEIALNALIPEELLNVEPKRKEKGCLPSYGYKGVPAQIREYLEVTERDPKGKAIAWGNPLDGSDRVVLEEEVELKDEEGEPVVDAETGNVVTSLEKTTYTRRWVDEYAKGSVTPEKIYRWVRLLPFSAGSPEQKIRYIKYKQDQEVRWRMEKKGQSEADARRLSVYQVPKVKDKKDGLTKDNSGAKELEKLYKATTPKAKEGQVVTGDMVFRHLVDIAKTKKTFGTYVRAWQFQKDGKWTSPDFLHTTFGVADTGTGQLTSTDPNVQNLPKHSAMGQELRGCIIAKVGKWLLEFDKKAFHAQTLAFEAKDKVYARISALDIHSFVTNVRLKLHSVEEMLKMSDKDMAALFDEQKADEKTIYKSEQCVAYPEGMVFQQVRDFKSKRVILGIGFCQGAGSIFEQNPEGYRDKKEVEAFLDILKGILSKTFQYQKETAQLAHKQQYLVSRYGYIRRFYDVFKWDSTKFDPKTMTNGAMVNGDDYEACVAFRPANNAFGMLKEEMLRLAGYRVDPPSNAPLDWYESTIWQEYLAAKRQINQRVSENLLEKYGFCNQIHDSLFFHCEDRFVDECYDNVLKVMREPSMVLVDPEMAPNGLFVDADAQIGKVWNKKGMMGWSKFTKTRGSY